MKKIALVALVLVGITAGSVSAFAQTSTSTPQVGSHRRPYVAGLVDSINNKGAWLLVNPAGTVIYLEGADANIVTLWKQVMKTLYFVDIN